MAFLGGFLIAIGVLLCAFMFLAAFTPFALIAPLLGVAFVVAGTRVLSSRPLPPPSDADRSG